MHPCAYCGLASSRPAPASTAIPSCIIVYTNRSRAFVSARRMHQGLSGRRLRGSLEQLRVTELLNVKHRKSSHLTTQAVALAAQFVLAREPGSGKSPRRSETAQAVALVRKFVPARKPGSSKSPRRLETAKAVASAEKFVPAREPGSSEGPRRSETAQPVAAQAVA